MIHPMHQYPTHLIDAVHLPDGSRVIVRPALPQDIDAECAGLGSARHALVRSAALLQD